MSDAVMMIAVSDIRPHCKGEPDIKERIAKAMRRAQEFFMSTDDNLRFKAALAAALLESPEDEKDRIVQSSRMISAVSAAMSGVPVNMDQALNTDDGFEPLPLIGMWHDAKAGAR
jgi:hypothetical protein